MLSAILAGLTTQAAYKWSRPESLAYGVTTSRCDVEGENKMRIFAVRVDTKATGISFTGTGRAPAPDYGKPLPEAKTLFIGEKRCEPADIRMAKETTLSFFERCARPVEQGGRGLNMIVAFTSLCSRPPHSGAYLDPHGLVISDGEVVADHPKGRAPLFVVRRNGSVDLAESLLPAEYGEVVVAHSLRTMIRRAGKDIVAPDSAARYPRISLGLTQDRRYVYILSVDDGVAMKKETGANHHEINEIFADLGCSDAASIDVGSTWAIVVKDRKNGARILNRMDVGADPSKSFGNIGIYIADPRVKNVVANPLAGQKPDVPANAAQISARLIQTHLSVAREKPPQRPETVLKGQVRMNVSSELARFKRPLLNVVALFDVDGVWQYAGSLVLDQKTSAGANLTREQTPQQISKAQPEVTASAWAQPVFGDPKVGFFKTLGVNAEKAKLLGYRLEVWQDGRLVTSYDSDRTTLKRLGVPDDWYVKGKYRGKLAYIWPPLKPAK